MLALIESYYEYKKSIARNIYFNGEKRNGGMSAKKDSINNLISVSTLPYNVQLVNVYLSTATFDEIEKDVKVTTEAALGLIGGTMGLFTGFSILSAVEIIYHLLKAFLSLLIFKRNNHLG